MGEALYTSGVAKSQLSVRAFVTEIIDFFILPPNIQALKERLFSRHKGQEKLIKQRMNKFNDEISHWNEYNYVVVNDDLDECFNKILKIIMSEKMGVSQKKNLDEIEKKIKELIK